MASLLLPAVLFCSAAALAQPNANDAPRGLAVLALPGATDAAWPLARDVYDRPALRAPGIDEARARVLAGEAPPKDAPKELSDLADTRAAVHGEDAPSKQLLASIARQLGARGVVVVDPTPRARVFLVETSDFDAATYAPDAGSQPPRWSAAIASMARAFGEPPRVSAPPAALHETPKVENMPQGPTPFYQSPWFWGALGAAAFLGGGAYFLTRDNSPSTIHLQMQVPR